MFTDYLIFKNFKMSLRYTIDENYLNDIISNSALRELKSEMEKYTYPDFINSINDKNNLWLRIIQTLPIVVFINDVNSCIWVNNACETVLGYTPSEWINQTADEFFAKYHPDDLEFLYEYSSRTDMNEGISTLNYRMFHKKGDIRYIYSLYFPLIFQLENSIHIRIGFAVDITEKVLRENELLQINNKLSESIEREKQLAIDKESLLKQKIKDIEKQLKKYSKLLQERETHLSELKNLLTKLKEQTNQNEFIDEFHQNVNIKLNDKSYWHNLEKDFYDNNPYFISHLSTSFNNLTSTELRVCAMIRINLRTKEIANLLGVSQRTIENHRLNIRKKLQIPDRQQLSVYIMQIV